MNWLINWINRLINGSIVFTYLLHDCYCQSVARLLLASQPARRRWDTQGSLECHSCLGRSNALVGKPGKNLFGIYCWKNRFGTCWGLRFHFQRPFKKRESPVDVCSSRAHCLKTCSLSDIGVWWHVEPLPSRNQGLPIENQFCSRLLIIILRYCKATL